MENRRTCEVCNVNVHKASFVKHLRSKKTFGKCRTKRNDYTTMVF